MNYYWVGAVPNQSLSSLKKLKVPAQSDVRNWPPGGIKVKTRRPEMAFPGVMA